MFEVQISKEGFGANNTNRPVWVERDKYFDTLEEAENYVLAKAEVQFAELKNSELYEAILFEYTILDENVIGYVERYIVEVKNGEVSLKKYINNGSDYGSEADIIKTEVQDTKRVCSKDSLIGKSFKDHGIVFDYDNDGIYVKDMYGREKYIKTKK